jgi:hypothetical protein
MNIFISMWRSILCITGHHDLCPEVNAKYDFCLRCGARFRAV